MAQLLLEILSEEIPARMQARAADDLKRLVCDGLKEAGLEFDNARAFVTPRRLALVVEGLPVEQPDVSEERRGPQVGAPDKAVQGFLGSVGLTLDQCKTVEVKGKEYYLAVIEKKGQGTAEVLAEILPAALAALPWPKSMRWGASETRWVRPLHSILCLFGRAVVPIAFAGIEAGAETQGHRFMAPDAFTASDFADYQAKLKKAKVILDAGERAEIIKTGAEKLAAAEGLVLRDDPALLAEVSGLVEWPVPLMGEIDAEFMEVPPEVLTSSMRAHQKYFALETKDGALAPHFITVANIETDDGGAAVTAGNERVLRARLSDARFFWDQDRKYPLLSRVAKLDEIVFHAKLGTLANKTRNMEVLAAALCEFIPGADADVAAKAARLSKADLTTGMVGEFPDLQGIIGRYYALNDGESSDVADAIAQHYSPAGPNDACPTAPTAVAVALADKIDSLVGFFAIDEKPTGSRDPFALRRAALGIIRIITENGLRLPLAGAFDIAERAYGESREGFEGKLDPAELLSFFADRLKVQMRGQGVRHDLIEAVFATPKPEGGAEDDLVRLLARVEALGEFLSTEDGANLLVAYKRAANIVAIEEKKDGKEYTDVKTDLFDKKLKVENVLWQNLRAVEKSLKVSLKGEIFLESMSALAQLRPPIDAFFDQVTVNVKNDDEVRENRLALLKSIVVLMNQVADFSQIEG